MSPTDRAAAVAHRLARRQSPTTCATWLGSLLVLGALGAASCRPNAPSGESELSFPLVYPVAHDRGDAADPAQDSIRAQPAPGPPDARGRFRSPGLSPAQLAAVVQENNQQLHGCYEAALRQAPAKKGTIVKIAVTVVVAADGTTQRVTTQGAGMGDMTDCIRARVERWLFPRSNGESEFAFPLLFQPS